MGKRFICIRHSTTQCNEALANKPWGTPGFEDPCLWDTVLSERGERLARDVENQLKLGRGGVGVDFSTVQLVVSSPLTRALQTSEILFGSNGLLPTNVRRVALPLLRERLYLASDVGKPRSQVAAAFQNWDFDLLPSCDSPWWYTPTAGDPVHHEWRPQGKYPTPGEPRAAFAARLSDLKSWLLSREETDIVLVSHWGVLRGLFGIDARNCEVRTMSPADFLDSPPLDC